MFTIGRSLAHSFVTQRDSCKVIINIADNNSSHNNFGFNLANFKPRFIREFYDDVVKDYERSFIGAFNFELLEHFLP